MPVDRWEACINHFDRVDFFCNSSDGQIHISRCFCKIFVLLFCFFAQAYVESVLFKDMPVVSLLVYLNIICTK